MSGGLLFNMGLIKPLLIHCVTRKHGVWYVEKGVEGIGDFAVIL